MAALADSVLFSLFSKKSFFMKNQPKAKKTDSVDQQETKEVKEETDSKPEKKKSKSRWLEFVIANRRFNCGFH